MVELRKKIRLADRKIYDFVMKRDRWCMANEFGECAGLDAPHHITHRGAGGDDVKENMIRLCAKHHTMAHSEKITREWMRERLMKKYGYTYD